MSMEPGSGANEELDFEHVQAEDGAETGQLSCSGCQRQITDRYFTAGQSILCDACRHRYEMELGQRSESKCFARAGLFGLLAAFAGAALWGGVIWLTGYELGLIAIVVGLMVGAAVKAGSGGRGGRRYQVMAVMLTYLSVSLAYVPLVIEGFRQAAQEQAAAQVDPEAAEPSLSTLDPEAAEPAPPAVEMVVAEAQEMPAADVETDGEVPAGAFVLAAIAVLAIAAAAPFLAGFENAIGLLIIGFALWQAWKMNALVDLSLSGPYDVGDAGGA